MKKGKSVENKIYSKDLEKSEIEETARLVAYTFVRYDPYMVFLEVDENEFYKFVKEDLENHLNDSPMTIVKEKATNKVVGLYVGIKLIYYQEDMQKPLETITVCDKEISVRKEINKASINEKLLSTWEV